VAKATTYKAKSTTAAGKAGGRYKIKHKVEVKDAHPATAGWALQIQSQSFGAFVRRV
jgi:hypothetical protein